MSPSFTTKEADNAMTIECKVVGAAQGSDTWFHWPGSIKKMEGGRLGSIQSQDPRSRKRTLSPVGLGIYRLSKGHGYSPGMWVHAWVTTEPSMCTTAEYRISPHFAMEGRDPVSRPRNWGIIPWRGWRQGIETGVSVTSSFKTKCASDLNERKYVQHFTLFRK